MGRHYADYMEMVEEIDNCLINLTKDWDVTFISDIIDNPPRKFSDKQMDQIDRIYGEAEL